MKKFLTMWAALIAITLFTACEKSEDSIPEEIGEISFDINQIMPKLASKEGGPKGDTTGVVPCIEGAVPTSVEVIINDVTYDLDLVTLNSGMETEVVKLPAGDYTISSFIVKDGQDAIYASPMDDSYYGSLWNLTGVTEEFTVLPFTKQKVEIDVLCYQPYSYEEFGFAWFQYAKYEIKTICFYGDICTKFFEEWHTYDDSPYAGQDPYGYDFPAIFEVIVKDAGGNAVNAVNDLTINDNLSYFGTGEPLCVEYPDLIGVDENYTFEIWLYMPDGSPSLVYSEALAEGTSSEQGNPNGFGGDDGVFDFVVGNCSYDGNNANLELPAWIPFPKDPIKFKVSVDPNSSEGYVQAQFDLDGGAAAITTIGELIDGQTYAMWCAEKDADIDPETWYTADVYSSLDPASMPDSIDSIPWGKLNWIMNHKDKGDFSTAQVQGALWYLIHGENHTGALEVAGLTDAAIAGWTPTVGDWAILAFDADGYDGRTDVQLMIVRVDP